MGSEYSREETGEKAVPKQARKMWAQRKMDKQTFQFTWTIHHFPALLSKFEKSGLASHVFTTGEHKWYLWLQLKSRRQESHFDLLLVPDPNPKKEEVHVGCKFGIVDGEGKRTSVSDVDPEVTGKQIGIFEFIEMDELLNEEKGYLSNDSLTLFCEVYIFGKPSNELSEGSPKLPSRPKVILPECHLANLPSYLKSLPSDVILTVEGKEFPSHKILLGSASPVFAAMFEHEMKEKIENCVEIEDVDLPVFEQFLYFIYTGKVDKLERIAKPLLVVAERYGVERLKAMCEESLASQLTVENMAHLHAFACHHNANQLKVITSKFLKRHL